MTIKPTESELEILQVLWSTDECTVRDVNERLSKQKGVDVGYTTTLKLMQIMHEKGLVERNTDQRTHIYKALISENDTRKNIVDKMIDTVFKGSAADLVMHALSNKSSSQDELKLIRDFLNKLDTQEEN
jgi:predicted transcriptional regulator